MIMIEGISPRDETRLRDVHPDLVIAYKQLHQAMQAIGAPIFVVSGARSDEAQQALYARGRSQPGSVVTQLDGITRRSRHQPTAEGYAEAIDVAFEGAEPFAERHPWGLLGEIGEHLGLVWGGRWPRFQDRPHFELPVEI